MIETTVRNTMFIYDTFIKLQPLYLTKEAIKILKINKPWIKTYYNKNRRELKIEENNSH